jgi:hypothetical protein
MNHDEEDARWPTPRSPDSLEHDLIISR